MKHKILIQGAIPTQMIADSIATHQQKTHIGAHNIFLGQVRADQIGSNPVTGIEYEAYPEMTEKTIAALREYAIEKYNLTCLHIYHSVGRVRAGEICFFVFVSASHRKQVYAATEDIVNKVKEDVPIFGKEWVAEQEFFWKQNT